MHRIGIDLWCYSVICLQWYLNKDINECLTGDHSCSSHGYCSDTDGSYECACQDGFEGDGVQCTNIDECELGLDKKLAVQSAEFDFTDNTTGTRFFICIRNSRLLRICILLRLHRKMALWMLGRLGWWWCYLRTSKRMWCAELQSRNQDSILWIHRCSNPTTKYLS